MDVLQSTLDSGHECLHMFTMTLETDVQLHMCIVVPEVNVYIVVHWLQIALRT